MNRRELFRVIAGVVPAVSAVNVEPPIRSDDLVVIECDQELDDEALERIRRIVHKTWCLPEQPKCIVLNAGLRLRVERGVARIETKEPS